MQAILQDAQESCSLARNLATFLQVLQDLFARILQEYFPRARFLHFHSKLAVQDLARSTNDFLQEVQTISCKIPKKKSLRGIPTAGLVF